MISALPKRQDFVTWATYFVDPLPGPPIFARTLAIYWITSTLLMTFATKRYRKESKGPGGIQKYTLGVQKVAARDPKKESLGAKLVLYGTKVVKKGGMRVTIGTKAVSKPSLKRLPCIQCAGHWRAAEGRSGTPVWRAAKGRLYLIVLVGTCWRAAEGRHRSGRNPPVPAVR